MFWKFEMKISIPALVFSAALVGERRINEGSTDGLSREQENWVLMFSREIVFAPEIAFSRTFLMYKRDKFSVRKIFLAVPKNVVVESFCAWKLFGNWKISVN